MTTLYLDTEVPRLLELDRWDKLGHANLYSTSGGSQAVPIPLPPHSYRVEYWLGELSSLPADYLVLDGSALAVIDYPELFEAMGYTFDSEPPEGMFRLPDTRGLAIKTVPTVFTTGEYQPSKVMYHSHTIIIYPWSANPFHATRNCGGGSNQIWSPGYIGPQHLPDRGMGNAPPATLGKNMACYHVVRISELTGRTNIVGEIAYTPAPTLPSKALRPDGREVRRAQYPALFAAIGTRYGEGDGVSTFNLPAATDLYIRAIDQGAGVDSLAADREDRGDGTTGDNVGTLQGSNVRAHYHYSVAASGGSQGGLGTTKTTTSGRQVTYTSSEDWPETPWDRVSAKDNAMPAIKLPAVIFYE